jgi:hypothetical protein
MPGATDREAGETDSVKSLTVRLPAVVRFRPAASPAMVKLLVPSGVLPVVVTVRVAVPGLAGFGENAQVAPVGSPLHASVTGELKPPTEVIVTV